MVAPMPPARTKAVANAAGTRMPTRLRMSSVPPSSLRRRPTARASCSLSRAMSRRTCSVVRASATVSPRQSGPGQLRLLERLLRDRGHAAAEPRAADREEHGRDDEKGAADDEERGPGGKDGRERGSGRREQEADREEREHAARGDESRPGADRRGLAPE